MSKAIKCILLSVALLMLIGLRATYRYDNLPSEKKIRKDDKVLLPLQHKRPVAKGKMNHVKQEAVICMPLPGEVPNIFISNNGNDNNPGTLALPKKTLDGSETAINAMTAQLSKVTVGLQSGNMFREQFDGNAQTTLRTYFGADSSPNFARISGMDIHNAGWSSSTGYTGLYEKNIPHSVNLYNPGYHFLVVHEIDTLLEKTAPFSARRMMPMAISVDKAASINGSYYTSPLDSPEEIIYINTSDDVAPGTGKFRYEITVREFAVRSNAGVEQLIIEPSAHGYGNSFGDSTLIRRCIFNGYGTHAVVFSSGSIESNLFIQGTKGLAQGSMPIVNYELEGAGNRSDFSGNIFLGTQAGPYVHQGGFSFGYQEEAIFTDNYFFGDEGYSTNAFGANLVKNVIVKDNYVENAWEFWTGVATDLRFEHNIFNNISGRSGVRHPNDLTVKTVLYNNLIKTGGNTAAQTPLNYANAFYFVNTRSGLDAANNIFHLKTDWTGTETPAGLFATLAANTRFKKNIIICDVPPGHYARVISADKKAMGTFAADSNVYVIVRGKGFVWTVLNSSSGNASLTALADWKAETGRDASSIVIDLRDNPNGLKDLFADPVTGNYQFAGTREADTVKALVAGMITPPFAFPSRPTKEEAVQSIMQPQPEPDCNTVNIRQDNRQLQVTGLSQAAVAVISISEKNSVKIFQHDYIHPPGTVNISLPPGQYAARISFFTLSGKLLCGQSLTHTVAQEPEILTESPVSVYPVPFQSFLTVTVQAESEEMVRLSVFDLSGRQIVTRRAFLQKGMNKLMIESLGELSPGSYFLRLSTAKGIEHFKLLKQ